MDKRQKTFTADFSLMRKSPSLVAVDHRSDGGGDGDVVVVCVVQSSVLPY